MSSGSSAARLVDKVRIGNLAPHDRHQVGRTLAKGDLCVLGCTDMAFGNHQGMPYDLFQARREVCSKPLRIEERRHEAAIVEIPAGAAGHVVDELVLVEKRDDFGDLISREGGRTARLVAYGQPDDKVRAATFPYAPQDLARQPDAVDEQAAPLVVALVVERRPELIEQTSIGGPDFHAVEAGLLAADRRRYEMRNCLLDLRLGHCVRAVAVMVARPTGRRPMRVVGEIGVAVTADVVELLQDDRAVLLDAVRQLLEGRDHRVVGVAKIAACEDGGGVNRHGLDDDHGRSAKRTLHVIGDVLIAGNAVVGHVCRVCTEHDPVAKSMAADADLRKDPREFCSHSRFLNADKGLVIVAGRRQRIA